MTTWQSWKQDHPATTVISLSRTAARFSNEYYRQPQAFVFGWVHEGEQPYAVGFDTLMSYPLLNLRTGDEDVVVTFDQQSTAVCLFSRVVDGQTLRFVAQSATRMKDESTGTVWNSQTGSALQGLRQGQQLRPLAGIMSYRRAWNIFHPDSQLLGPHPVPSEAPLR